MRKPQDPEILSFSQRGTSGMSLGQRLRNVELSRNLAPRTEMRQALRNIEKTSGPLDSVIFSTFLNAVGTFKLSGPEIQKC